MAVLFGALLAAAPLHVASAQNTPGLTFKAVPERAPDERAAQRPRIDLSRIGEDPFEQAPDLFGIPLTADSNATNRERGFSFGLRPVKGVRAVVKLRF